MIGMELLQLLQGDPLAQMRMGPQPAPNPNPQAPPPQQAMPPVNQPTMQRQSPAPAGIGGPPGHFETLPIRLSRRTGFLGPATGPIRKRPPPLIGTPPGGGQPNPSPGPQAAPPPPNPLPQSGPPSVASQSPPDLVNLYMRLMQQQRAGSAIDHGLALMASAYAAPGTQGQIMHSMDNQQQDPSAMMGNLVQLQQMQNMNAARPAMMAALRRWRRRRSAAGRNTGCVLNAIPNDQLVKLIDQRAQSGLQIQQQGAEEKQKDLIEAQTKLPEATKSFNDIDNRINAIKSTTNDDGSSALESILSSPSKQNAAKALMAAPDEGGMTGSWYEHWQQRGLTPQEITTIAQMKQLSSQAYGEAFQSTGSRRTQQEVNNLKAALTQIGNINQPYELKDAKGNVIGGYKQQLDNFQNNIHTGVANAYGAAGQLDAVPDNLKFGSDGTPLVSSIYRPGGSLYGGRGGSWVNQPPPQSQGAPAGGGRALAGSDLDQVRAAIAANPGDRDRILSTVSKNGYSTGGL